jgi:hypothetical protein
MNKIKANLKYAIDNTHRKIIITGFSDECLAAAECLRAVGREVYAYASDDLPFVVNKNKNNIIFAEKYVNGLETDLIEIIDFYEAIRVPGVLLVVSTDHYDNILTNLGFVEGSQYIRINR